jgi:hypothetical protein
MAVLGDEEIERLVEDYRRLLVEKVKGGTSIENNTSIEGNTSIEDNTGTEDNASSVDGASIEDNIEEVEYWKPIAFGFVGWLVICIMLLMLVLTEDNSGYSSREVRDAVKVNPEKIEGFDMSGSSPVWIREINDNTKYRDLTIREVVRAERSDDSNFTLHIRVDSIYDDPHLVKEINVRGYNDLKLEYLYSSPRGLSRFRLESIEYKSESIDYEAGWRDIQTFEVKLQNEVLRAHMSYYRYGMLLDYSENSVNDVKLIRMNCDKSNLCALGRFDVGLSFDKYFVSEVTAARAVDDKYMSVNKRYYGVVLLYVGMNVVKYYFFVGKCKGV